MAVKWRVGVIRASDGTSRWVPDGKDRLRRKKWEPFPEAAARSALTGIEHSMLRYWTDMTYGLVRFFPTFLPAIELDIPDSEFARTWPDGKTIRGTYIYAEWAVRELSDAHDVKWDQFDSLIIFMSSGLRDGGAGGIPAGDRTLPFVLTNQSPTANRGFIAHEIGHTLGLDHTYGIYWGQTTYDDPASGKRVIFEDHCYGSPHDIMSHGIYGSSNPRFAPKPIASWPVEMNDAMGPAVSRAALHWKHPNWFAAGKVKEVALAAGASTGLTLSPALGGKRGPELLIIDPPAGERIYVEYRSRFTPEQNGEAREGSPWDAGLRPTNGDNAIPGVVVHTVSQAQYVGDVVWWRGVIPVPRRGDDDVRLDSSGYRVVLASVDDDSVTVRIEPDTGPKAWLTIDSHRTITGDRGDLEQRDTNGCGQYPFGTWQVQTEAAVTFSSAGLGGSGPTTGLDTGAVPAPAIQWNIGGNPIQAIWPSGVISVETTMPLTNIKRRMSITYRVEGATITLTAPSSTFVQSLRVTATGTDANGISATASGTVTIAADIHGFRPGDAMKIAICKIGPIEFEEERGRPTKPWLEHPDWIFEHDLVLSREIAKMLENGRIEKPGLRQLVSATGRLRARRL